MTSRRVRSPGAHLSNLSVEEESPDMKMRMTAVLIALVAVVSGCGDDTSSDKTSINAQKTSTYPITLNSGGQATEIDKRPERIVSLSPTATESLFAIDAGRQVVAVDNMSN